MPINLLSTPEQRPTNLLPQEVPGCLLNIALLNCCSVNAELRVASYSLLASMDSSFNLQMEASVRNAQGMYIFLPFSNVPGLCIPPNSLDFVIQLSTRLSKSAKHLTLEFLSECCIGLANPWIKLRGPAAFIIWRRG